MTQYRLLHILTGKYRLGSFETLEDAQTQLSIVLMYSDEWNNHPEMSMGDRRSDYEIVEIFDD